METNARSLAKAVSYRLAGSITTGVIFYILSGKITLSVGAGALDMVAKIGLYFLHERLWTRIPFGRSKPPEYEI
jgi:adenylylsulfate kinase